MNLQPPDHGNHHSSSRARCPPSSAAVGLFAGARQERRVHPDTLRAPRRPHCDARRCPPLHQHLLPARHEPTLPHPHDAHPLRRPSIRDRQGSCNAWPQRSLPRRQVHLRLPGRARPTTERKSGFKYPTRDGYRFFLEAGTARDLDAKFFEGRVAFWRTMMQHPNYDEFWRARNLLPHLRKVAPAVMTVGGWYDAEDLYGACQTYRAVEKQNPGIFNVLVVGPWAHGGWAGADGPRLGDATFGSNTSAFFQDNIER